MEAIALSASVSADLVRGIQKWVFTSIVQAGDIWYNDTMLCSVLVPIYNGEAHLAAMLDSVLAQDMAEWECILSDDGSTDASVEICRRYCAMDARFRLLTFSHSGASVMRNAMLRESKGGCIFFADQDDLLHSRLLSTCVSAMERCDAGFAYFDGVSFTGDDVDLLSLSGASCEALDAPLRTSLEEEWGRAVWRYLYRREALDGIWFDESYALCNDRTFQFRVLKRGLRCARIHAPLYFYRRHPMQSVNRPLTERAVDGYARCMMQVTDMFIGEAGTLELLRRHEFVPLVKSLFRKALSGGKAEIAHVANLFFALRRNHVLGYGDFSLKWRLRLWQAFNRDGNG